MLLGYSHCFNWEPLKNPFTVSLLIAVKVGESNNFAYHVPDWSKDVSFAGLKCRYEMRDFFFADDLKCSGVSNEVVRPQVRCVPFTISISLQFVIDTCQVD